MTYPSPCETCTRDEYGCSGCNAWLTRYRYRQKRINAKARQIFRPAKVPATKLCYRHPDEARRYLLHSPCEGCILNKNCDTPCSAYLQWYDDRMALARRKFHETE